MSAPTVILAPARITVMQGQARVSSLPGEELTTVLGSCIATCLFDPAARLGGMNHFLLAEPVGSDTVKVDEHYGVYLMEVLINEMLARGATKSGMRAHLYGGANLHSGMTDIGAANAAFARDFLVRERIPLLRADTGGRHARRVDFRASGGQARCRHIVHATTEPERPIVRPASVGGDVELF